MINGLVLLSVAMMSSRSLCCQKIYLVFDESLSVG